VKSLAKLYLCALQEQNYIPYEFKITHVKVFSIEEAIYHCYHNWQKVQEDFLSQKFISWVKNTLGLKDIAENLTFISKEDDFYNKFLSFICLNGYLSEKYIKKISKKIKNWQNKHLWERLKEQGDLWHSQNEHSKALSYYYAALEQHKDEFLLNNIGITLMKLSRFKEAVSYFLKAVDINPEFLQFKYNLIEAHILSQNIDTAKNIIYALAMQDPKNPETHYYQGEIFYNQKHYFKAMETYQKAIAIEKKPAYIYRLCDCFLNIRLYDKALETLEGITDKGAVFLKKQAQCYFMSNNIPKAIKAIERAIFFDPKATELWTLLATYYRLDYDNNQAQLAISKALLLSPSNPHALMEQALIKKAQGRIKEYQEGLRYILEKFKMDYRESLQII